MKLTKEQLAAMSREDKKRLLDLIEEKKRRNREARASYVPNAGQAPVHASRALLRLVLTGNGGGKTASAIHEAMWAALGWNPVHKENTPVPARVYVVLDRPDKVDSTWLPELQHWFVLKPGQLHKNGKPFINRITFDNGSFIQFLFHEQDPLTFESLEGDVFIFDEPPPRHVYIGLRRAGRTKGRRPRYLIIGTPLAAPWLRTDIYEPWAKGDAPDTECFRFSTEVNRKNLKDGYIEEFGAVLTEKERQIRLHGAFFDIEGLALAHLFKRDVHVLSAAKYKFDQSWPVVIAIDPHPNKKHVAVMIGADKDGLVVLKELAMKSIPREFARALKEFYRGYRVLDIVCDSLGATETTGGEGFKSFIQVLQDEGVRVRSTTYADKSDEDWIQRIQDALAIPAQANNFGQKIPKLRVMDHCRGVIGDIETVQWTKYRNMDEYKPKLDIGAKDFLACVKYGLACNLHFLKRKERAYAIRRPVYGMASARRGVK